MRLVIPNTPNNPITGLVYAVALMTIGILCAVVAAELWPYTGFAK